jgi:hypothetical protein
MSKTKAIHLKHLTQFVHERGGEVAWQKIMDALAERDREVLGTYILPGAWIDYGFWWRLLTAADRVLGRGDGKIIREIGAYDAHQSLNGVYKAFISLMNPGFVIARSSLLWKRYYDTGDIRVVQAGARLAELELVDFPDAPRGHEQELIGWMETALKLTKVANVSAIHTQCRARGDAACLFSLRWD